MANRKPHSFTAEQRAKGLEAARLARMNQAKARREAKTANAHQPVETVEELQDRAKEALQPEEHKGQKLELAKTFSQFLILGTVLGAYAMQQPALAMTDAEAGAVAIPLASMFARTGLNRQIGRYLVGSNDYVALVWAAFQYGQRVAGSWIPNEKIHTIRHSPEAGNGRVPAASNGASPKSATSQPAADGITIVPNILGGGWRAGA